MQGKLADMYTTLNARLCVCRRFRLHDRGEITRKDAAGVIPTPREGHPMALEAIQRLGGNGYINDYPTGRLLRTPSFTRSAPALGNPPHAYRPGSVRGNGIKLCVRRIVGLLACRPNPTCGYC